MILSEFSIFNFWIEDSRVCHRLEILLLLFSLSYKKSLIYELQNNRFIKISAPVDFNFIHLQNLLKVRKFSKNEMKNVFENCF